jgi:hypothetical protein
MTRGPPPGLQRHLQYQLGIAIGRFGVGCRTTRGPADQAVEDRGVLGRLGSSSAQFATSLATFCRSAESAST